MSTIEGNTALRSLLPSRNMFTASHDLVAELGELWEETVVVYKSGEVSVIVMAYMVPSLSTT
jgi:hypothetical protein